MKMLMTNRKRERVGHEEAETEVAGGCARLPAAVELAHDERRDQARPDIGRDVAVGEQRAAQDDGQCLLLPGVALQLIDARQGAGARNPRDLGVGRVVGRHDVELAEQFAIKGRLCARAVVRLDIHAAWHLDLDR
jgi:hypothetical protein